MELHLQVKEARKQAGLTQEELARRANVGRTDVSRFEQGENVTMKTFLRIVGALPDLRELAIDDNLHMRKGSTGTPLSAEGAPALPEAEVMSRLATAFLQNLPTQGEPQQQASTQADLPLLRALGQLIVEMAIRGKVF